jgi:carboxymethylenebutenolidase
MYEIRRVQHRITSGHINIVADSHYLPAFWAHPELGGSFPGVVALHEWWGLNAQIRSQVRRLAELGFYVIAPDLFNGRTAHRADEGLALQHQLGEAGAARVAAALGVLETHHRFNGKIGVVGWQMGGELAYHAALHRTDLNAAVVFYGKPDAYLTLMPANPTPILAFYGEKDQMASPQMIERVRTALAKSPGKGEIVIYPGTHTGFFNEELPTYQPQAATAAWNKMSDFLSERLQVNAGPDKDDTQEAGQQAGTS